MARSASALATLMSAPPLLRIRLTASREPYTCPQKFTSIWRRMSSTRSSMISPYIETAALLTQVSMRSNSAMAASAMPSTSSGSLTSATT